CLRVPPHFCSNSQAFDRRSGFKQLRDLVLVEISAGEDSYTLQARLVENLPRGDTETREIAGIQTNRTHFEIRPQLGPQSHDLSNACQSVAGIDQQARVGIDA